MCVFYMRKADCNHLETMIKLVGMNFFTESMPLLKLKQSSVFLPTVSDNFGWFEL